MLTCLFLTKGMIRSENYQAMGDGPVENNAKVISEGQNSEPILVNGIEKVNHSDKKTYANGIWEFESVQWLDSTVTKNTIAQSIFYFHDSIIDVPFSCKRSIGCECPDGFIRLNTKWENDTLLFFTPQKKWQKIGRWNGLQFILEEKNYKVTFKRIDLDALIFDPRHNEYSNNYKIVNPRLVYNGDRFEPVAGLDENDPVHGIWRLKNIVRKDPANKEMVGNPTLFLFRDSTVVLRIFCMSPVNCPDPDAFVRFKAKFENNHLYYLNYDKKWVLLGIFNDKYFQYSGPDKCVTYKKIHLNELSPFLVNEPAILKSRKIINYR